MAVYTTIDDPEAYFQVVTYTGNGSANHAITLPGTTDMQPDLVWIKNRDATDSHCLFDAVRGATKVIHSDSTAAESTDADTLDSFTSDGFQVDADVKVNTNAEKYVAWCWKANGTGSSNTDGTINTGATSANTTSGFSISTYTGTGSAATVGHGLGVAPALVITKRRASSDASWAVFHHKNTAEPETDNLKLDTTAATADDSGVWNDTAPSSTVFSAGDDGVVNASGSTYVAYAFADVQGFSKFGTYEGNGNVDGPFLYCGFRPAFILIKRTTAAADWQNMDHRRGTGNGNPAHEQLWASTSNAESSDYDQDFVSNGFKLRNTGTHRNGAGDTYVFAAFAYSPFVNSNGVPCNAR